MADATRHRLCSLPFGMPGALSFTNHVVDANTEGIAFAFQAESDAPLTGFQFRFGARTGSSDLSMVATLESPVITTGLPDGADVGGGSPTAKIFALPNDTSWDGTCQNITFTNAYTPTRGQLMIATIRYSSGTIDGSNNGSFTRITSGISLGSLNSFPYVLTNAAGTWSKVAGTYPFMVITGTVRYGFPMEAIWATASASTATHRHALRFTLPGTSTYKIRKFRWVGPIAGAAAKAPIFGLWSAAGVLTAIALDSDIGQNPIAATRNHEFCFDDTPATLTGGTTYYIGMEVVDAVNGQVKMEGIQLDHADDGAAYPGGASNWCLSTYDGANWSDNALVRPFAEMELDDITEPAGSAGMIFPRMMNGGLVG